MKPVKAKADGIQYPNGSFVEIERTEAIKITVAFRFYGAQGFDLRSVSITEEDFLRLVRETVPNFSNRILA
jgi:hypothetical protein